MGEEISCFSLLDAFGTTTEVGSVEMEKGKLETHLVPASTCENAGSYLTETVVAVLICCWREETQ